MDQEEESCDEVVRVKVFTYLGKRESVGGGCEVAVTARTRLGGLSIRRVSNCANVRKCHLKLK